MRKPLAVLGALVLNGMGWACTASAPPAAPADAGALDAGVPDAALAAPDASVPGKHDAGLLGPACSSTEVCGAGAYCADNGHCQVDCSPADGGCGPHQECVSHGICAFTSADPAAGVCAAQVAQGELLTPTVMVLVDQSGSMSESYPGGSRWSVLRTALIDSSAGVVARLQHQVRFGLALYTSHNGGVQCPLLDSVEPAVDNLAPIQAVYSAAGPDGDTPTGESLDKVVQLLLNDPGATGPRSIILATDGEPDTCAVPNPQTGQPQSLAAAANAWAHGIGVFILSVGQGDVSLRHLQDMANAGAGLPVGGTEHAPYYDARNQADLTTALDAIVGRVLSCVVAVDGSIDANAAADGEVRLDGELVPYGTADGWVRVDANSIQLQGAACARAQVPGDHTVTVEIPCFEMPG